MKKLFAIALAAVLAMSTMTATATLATTTPDPIAPFIDVFTSTDYNGSIIWMSDNNVIQGYGNGVFGPDYCVTRSELLKMIFEMKEIDETTSTAELFTDTPEGEWYAPYVRTARERNTIQGYEDGTFKPGQCVNRVEAMKIAMLEFTKMNQSEDAESTWINYVDILEDAWYKQYFNQAINTNTVGTKHTEFNYENYNYGYNFFPGDPMSRKEVAEMLFRLKAIADLSVDYYESTILPTELVEIPVTNHILTIEDIFPKDIFATLELDLSSSTEITNFNNLLAKFPNVDNTTPGIEDSIDIFLDLIGTSDYQADFETAFQDNTNRIVVGLDANESALLAIEVKDNSKINRLIEKITSGTNPLYYEQNVLGFRTITSIEGYVNMTLAGNVILIAENAQAQYMTLRNIKNEGPVLAENSIYKIYQSSDLAPKFASLFINLDAISSFSTDVAELLPTLAYGDVSSENISFSADKNGLAMLVQADMSLDVTYKQPYMYREIPGKNLLMYMEAYGLDEAFKMQADALKEISYEYNSVLNEFEDATGMSLEDDIFNTMNAGYAIVWQENTNLMPGISIYADVNENKVAAEAMVNKMHTGISAMVDEMVATAPDGIDGAKVFKLDTVKVGGRDVHRLTIDFNAIPASELEDADLPMGFFGEPIEFFYGITSDNYLVISNYADLEQEYGSTTTVSRDAGLTSAKSNISDYEFGISYINVTTILDYVDSVIAEMEIMNGAMSVDEREEYEMIMSYIRPIKYIISANGSANSAEIMKAMLFVGM
ncbi:S-layer homology domain-containing protein [Patescibacteria group bacterium]|nr:S-layer homology domain-containing protein [Patescibacteria group bacterium]